MIQYGSIWFQTVANMTPNPSLVRHFTGVQSRLYEPVHAGFGVFALIPVLEQKYYKQH
jgi:hypothetical protein